MLSNSQMKRYLGRGPAQRSSVLLEFGASAVAHGSDLVHQPGSSVHLLLLEGFMKASLHRHH